MPEFSIVTIVKGRRKQLGNLLASIKNSTILPIDIHIVCMDEPDDIFISNELDVVVHGINSQYSLPLAAARNLGINASKTESIIFIDVDCIVSPTLFQSLLRSLKADKIIAAYPLYLPILPEHGNYAELVNLSVAHPSRENIPFGKTVPHLQFWSLIFAVQKQTFKKIGGFDESFTGYGAEDTDFAMTFHEKSVEQIFVDDYILHQYHDKYDPPLNHFNSIIDNAIHYQKKWKVLPMQRWLKAFEDLGLISITSENQINVIQNPSEKQIQERISLNPY